MRRKKIPFYKMSGSGNDFIVVDNRQGIVEEKNLENWIAAICRRKHSVGADGLILIENSEQADFKWRYFNADGGEAEMCGNGGRCAARLAHLLGIASSQLSFETQTGVIRAEVTGLQVKLEMPKPTGIDQDISLTLDEKEWTLSHVTVGVPHVVVWLEEIESAPVLEVGSAIRYHAQYAPAGTNVNFAQSLPDGTLAIRTYERGVEDETLACGTGSVATALIAHLKGMAQSPVTLVTRGGDSLRIHFQAQGHEFRDVFLEGDARIIYEGNLWEEAAG